MSIYTVLEPPPKSASAAERADRFVFIRDGFSWGAFFFTPAWMLYRRLWLAFVVYAVLIIALQVGLRVVGVGLDGQMLIGALIALLIGFEAANLRRWTLTRRRWRELGTVMANDREAAERRFFDAWVNGDIDFPVASAGPPASIIRPPSGGHRRDVIGLFPEPGGSR